jgi:hypothetical protein
MCDQAIERRACRLCGTEIPQRRLAALPETRLCVACSSRTGGEQVLTVTLNSTGKTGSLKKTGEEVSVTLVPKRFA